MTKSGRRKFLMAASGLTVAGKALARGKKAKNPNPIAHHVFFWLKDPGSVTDRDKLVEGVKTLSEIETVREIHIGIIADTEKRDVVDTSWEVSELMFFRDLDGQRTYQSHPVHQAFVKNYGHLWSKVVVYDVKEVWPV